MIELVNNLHVAYTVDEYCAHLLGSSLENQHPEVQDLAGCLARHFCEGPFTTHVVDHFTRYLGWRSTVGIVPYSYVAPRDAGLEAVDVQEFLDPLDVRRGSCRESSIFASMTEGMGRPGSNFQRYLAVLRRVPDSLRYDLRFHFGRFVRKKPSVGQDEVDAVALNIFRILRLHYYTPLLFIPPLDFGHTEMVYSSVTEKTYAADRLGNFYHTQSVESLSLDSPLTSLVYAAGDTSGELGNLMSTYTRAAGLNAKRSVITAPQKEGKQEATEGAVNAIIGDPDRLPKAMFENLIQHQAMMSGQQRSTLANTQGGVAGHIMSSGFAVDAMATMYNLNMEATQIRDEQVYNDFKERLDRMRASSESYGYLKSILKAAEHGDSAEMMRIMGLMSIEDATIFQDLLGCRGNSNQEGGPDIFRMPENTKILCSYTTNIGLSDLEECLHLWSLFWEGIFTGTNIYTRRRHALQYTGKTKHSLEPDVVTQMAFLQLLNAGGVIMNKLYQSKMTNLTFTEIMLLADRVPAESIKEVLASHLGVFTSTLRFRQDIDEDKLPSVQIQPETPREITEGLKRQRNNNESL